MKPIASWKLALAVSSLAGVAFGQTTDSLFGTGGVAIWGAQTDTPQWNQALSVKYTRQGCSDAPSACMSFVE
jgi:hypothetical protein